MISGGVQRSFWSALVVTFVIMGSYLDTLPAPLLVLDFAVRDEVQDDLCDDTDLDDVVDVAWHAAPSGSRPRRPHLDPLGIRAVEPDLSPTLRRRLSADLARLATPPRLTSLLCRLTC